MPTPTPISKEVTEAIEDLIDQSRLAGFDHGHAVGYEKGFNDCLGQIRARLGALKPIEPKNFVDIVREELEISEEPSPIKEAYGYVITDAAPPKLRKKRLVSVKALGLSTKTTNALTNAGVTKVKQLTEMSAVELRKLPRIGAGSVQEILAALKKHGKALKG